MLEPVTKATLPVRSKSFSPVRPPKPGWPGVVHGSAAAAAADDFCTDGPASVADATNSATDGLSELRVAATCARRRVAGSDCKTSGYGEARGRRMGAGCGSAVRCLRPVRAPAEEVWRGKQRAAAPRRTDFLAAGFFAEAAARFFGGILLVGASRGAADGADRGES